MRGTAYMAWARRRGECRAAGEEEAPLRATLQAGCLVQAAACGAALVAGGRNPVAAESWVRLKVLCKPVYRAVQVRHVPVL